MRALSGGASSSHTDRWVNGALQRLKEQRQDVAPVRALELERTATM